MRSRDLAPDIECVGAVSQTDYESVATVVAAEGFFSLAARYGAHPDYPPTVLTSATRDGTQTTVRNYPVPCRHP